MPAFFLLGERPAGAVRGARRDDILAFGVCVDDDGRNEGGGIDFVGVRVKLNPSCLLFLDGDVKVEGSTFSESNSSNIEGAARLPGEITLAGFTGAAVALPPSGGFWDRIPILMSIHVLAEHTIHRTILTILNTGKVLQARAIEHREWLSDGSSHIAPLQA